MIRCLAKAPPELAQDFLSAACTSSAAAGMLRGLAQRIERETEVPVQMSPMPLEAVVLGAGHCIEHYEALKGDVHGGPEVADPMSRIRVAADATEIVAAGLAAIREEFDVPGEFPAEVRREADAAAASWKDADRPDRTDLPLVTTRPCLRDRPRSGLRARSRR